MPHPCASQGAAGQAELSPSRLTASKLQATLWIQKQARLVSHSGASEENPAGTDEPPPGVSL